MTKLQTEFSDQGLVVIGIDGYGGSKESVAKFVEDTQASHTILMSGVDVANEKYFVTAYPTTFWIGRDGSIIKRTIGFDPNEFDEFRSEVAKWVESTNPSASKTDQTLNQFYSSAIKEYEAQNFKAAAKLANQFLEVPDNNTSPTRLYNCACIFSLAGESNRAFDILETLAKEHFYSDVQHITSDPDLATIRKLGRWQVILDAIGENKKTEPARIRKRIKSELLKAKELLEADGGNLWGHKIWTNNLIVLDFDNTIYSFKALPGSQTDDSVLYYKSVLPNTLSFTNSSQQFEGEEYAVVMTHALDDDSKTIIHELFHVLQLKAKRFRGDPIDYLDQSSARILMRLEYEALRNALSLAAENLQANEIEKQISEFLIDAIRFRKMRQSENRGYQDAESEIETLEGMANYTGVVLSSRTDKFQQAIQILNRWESAKTYTRTFPYATGPAYGLLFDRLGFDWKTELNSVYDFVDIVEENIEETISVDEEFLKVSKARNNFEVINEAEQHRKAEHEKSVAHYTRLLLNQPTLRATVTAGDGTFAMSYDMNGTLVLGDEGTVYSQIKGTDVSGKNFGSFNSIAGRDSLGSAGILRRTKNREFVFPFPTKIDGQTIVGEYYEIHLNDGWTVKKINEQGDLQIVPNTVKPKK